MKITVRVAGVDGSMHSIQSNSPVEALKFLGEFDHEGGSTDLLLSAEYGDCYMVLQTLSKVNFHPQIMTTSNECPVCKSHLIISDISTLDNPGASMAICPKHGKLLLCANCGTFTTKQGQTYVCSNCGSKSGQS